MTWAETTLLHMLETLFKCEGLILCCHFAAMELSLVILRGEGPAGTQWLWTHDGNFPSKLAASSRLGLTQQQQ